MFKYKFMVLDSSSLPDCSRQVLLRMTKIGGFRPNTNYFVSNYFVKKFVVFTAKTQLWVAGNPSEGSKPSEGQTQITHN